MEFWLALPDWGRVVVTAVIVVTAVPVVLGGVRRVKGSVSRDQFRDTVAPLALAAVILALAFEGLREFAEDQMGIPAPLSWFVIAAFELTALWFAWIRFARAERQGSESPFALLMTWAIIALTAGFQYSHAVAVSLDGTGTLARTVLPLILGVVVEWALHLRRRARRDEDQSRRRRVVDRSLRMRPVEWLRVQRTMAAHPSWTADQALAHVRAQAAGRVLYRLRERDNGRREQRAIRAAEAAGFVGEPTGDAMTDALRDMWVRTHVRELARMDYTPGNVRAFRATMAALASVGPVAELPTAPTPTPRMDSTEPTSDVGELTGLTKAAAVRVAIARVTDTGVTNGAVVPAAVEWLAERGVTVDRSYAYEVHRSPAGSDLPERPLVRRARRSTATPQSMSA